MRYTIKPFTALPGNKILSEHFYLKNGARYEKKIDDKLVQHHRYTTRQYFTQEKMQMKSTKRTFLLRNSYNCNLT